MNSLTIRGRLWIASDIHLGPGSPATAEAFRNFLEQAERRADALIIAGDLFDAWIGDDIALHEPEPWLAQAIEGLQKVARQIPLWLGHGNRDFLMGSALMRHLGARHLPDPVLLETDAGTILLAHGDQYCTADLSYQRFRRVVRRPGVQRAYLALPRALRKRIAMWARERSMHHNQYKHMEIMDVEADAVSDALRQARANVLIHGHTHRPARHSFTVDGLACERVVIPDWDFDHSDPPRCGWITIDRCGVQLVQES